MKWECSTPTTNVIVPGCRLVLSHDVTIFTAHRDSTVTGKQPDVLIHHDEYDDEINSGIRGEIGYGSSNACVVSFSMLLVLITAVATQTLLLLQ